MRYSRQATVDAVSPEPEECRQPPETSRTRSTSRETPTLLKTCFLCQRTVSSSRPVARAMSRMVRPSASSAATTDSAGVSPKAAATRSGSIRTCLFGSMSMMSKRAATRRLLNDISASSTGMACSTVGHAPLGRVITIEPLTPRSPYRGSARPRSFCNVVFSANNGVKRAPSRYDKRLPRPQQSTGTVVRRRNPPVPVQLDDANPGIIQQGGRGRVPTRGADQRLPDPDKLPDLGQQRLQKRDLRRPPAIRIHRIAEGPGDVGTIRRVQTHVQTVLAVGPDEHLVVGWRGLQLLGRVEVADVHQTAVGQLPHAR